MELRFRKITPQDPVVQEVKALYEASFPPEEQRPFYALFSEFYGEGEMLAFFDGECFAGMVMLLSFEDITHILYFAVAPELRDRGYGSRILELIREQYPGQRIIADLERPEENAENEAQREKRIAFYEKNGYRSTGIDYRWEKQDYLIMSNGGNVTREEFGRFWRWFYTER